MLCSGVSGINFHRNADMLMGQFMRQSELCPCETNTPFSSHSTILKSNTSCDEVISGLLGLFPCYWGAMGCVLTVCLEKAQEKSRTALILGLLNGPAEAVLVSVHQCYLLPPMKSLLSASSWLIFHLAFLFSAT